MSIIVAGFGNVLRKDDGFGVAVAERLLDGQVPEGVTVIEVGIGGIHLVQELLDRRDALIIVDAVDLDRPPGTVVVIEPPTTDLSSLDSSEQRDLLADMHYATPERALLLLDALGVRPATTLIVGVAATDAEGWGEGLSRPVEEAVEPAVREVRRLVTELGVQWTERSPGVER